MPKKSGIYRVLIIGSGPVVIGQSAEFDYAGSQAVRSLREEGIYTVLLNSNPATIQTDYEIADSIYIEPMELDVIVSIIEKENIDSLLCTMGGQTALNLLMEIEKAGLIEKYGLNVLGTQPDNIRNAEDRNEFHKKMISLGENIPDSAIITSSTWKDDAEHIKFYPFIARTSFSLGGKAGRIVENKMKAVAFFNEVFSDGDISEIEIEASLLGLKELEYEIIRDSSGNAICVCNMENLDPMGIHTGESIVVTPSLTLNDFEYYSMREHALKIAESLDIIGACNVQFALDQKKGMFYVVEVNPRTSRSSALASKASGYPIARIATKLCIGYLLSELKNPITGSSSASFEPSLDYVTVKIPKWPFEKFRSDISLGVSMKSTGEVMGIGRTFEEAMFKAIASLEDEQFGFDLDISLDKLEEYLKNPTHLRLRAIIQALNAGISVDKISEYSGWDIEILNRLNSAISMMKESRVNIEKLEHMKHLGIPDFIIAKYFKMSEREISAIRIEKGINSSMRMIDTSSNEFNSRSGYFYSTYFEKNDAPPLSPGNSVMIIGSGPNRISQGLEYDFGSVKTLLHLKRANIPTIMINSNPETVSTDYDVSGRLYFEPLKLEYIANIIEYEKPRGVIIQFSGQTGQNMAGDLAAIFGEEIILGTSPENIGKIEDRVIFSNAMNKLKLPQTEFRDCNGLHELLNKVEEIGFPVILRTSFIIGGSSVRVVESREELNKVVNEYERYNVSGRILANKFLENYDEMDIDFISNGKEYKIAGVSVHVEEAGIHSGDAVSLTGPNLVDAKTMSEIENILSKLTAFYSLKGFSNLQLAVKGDDIRIIELNARLSRSFSFICKATGIDWIRFGIDAILFGNLPEKSWEPVSFSAKIPIFPFKIFQKEDISVGPEMRSTGEVMVSGLTMEELWSKIGTYYGMRKGSDAKIVVYACEDDVLSLEHIFAKDERIKMFNTLEYEKMLEFVDDEKNMVFADLSDVNESRKASLKRTMLRKGIPIILNKRLFLKLMYSIPNGINARESRNYHNGI